MLQLSGTVNTGAQRRVCAGTGRTKPSEVIIHYAASVSVPRTEGGFYSAGRGKGSAPSPRPHPEPYAISSSRPTRFILATRLAANETPAFSWAGETTPGDFLLWTNRDTSNCGMTLLRFCLITGGREQNSATLIGRVQGLVTSRALGTVEGTRCWIFFRTLFTEASSTTCL